MVADQELARPALETTSVLAQSLVGDGSQDLVGSPKPVTPRKLVLNVAVAAQLIPGMGPEVLTELDLPLDKTVSAPVTGHVPGCWLVVV